MQNFCLFHEGLWKNIKYTDSDSDEQACGLMDGWTET